MNRITIPTKSSEGRPAPRTRPHVKICGLKSEAMIEAALSRGAREIGLVHFPPSPRHLAIDDMMRLRTSVGGRALVTVVTVDADDLLLKQIALRVRPDFIQLHGGETPARVAEIGALTAIATMKALAVAEANDVKAVAAYRAVADRILLDAKRPAGSPLPGGNGVAFDWNLLGALGEAAEFTLSGGINPDNVAEAVRCVRPHTLDVSSGVERSPGVKDAGLIHRLFDALDTAILTQLERQVS